MNSWVAAQKEELRSDVLKLTLYELVNAISPRENRMKAINATLKEFSHNDPSKHNQELDLHADKILFQKLAFCYTNRKYDEELGLLSCALEMVYRANTARVAISFHEVGESLLPLFVEMMKHSAPRRKDMLLKDIAARELINDTDSISTARSGSSHQLSATNRFESVEQMSSQMSRSSMQSSSSKAFKSKTMLSTVSEEKKGERFEDEEQVRVVNAEFENIRLGHDVNDMTECSTDYESDNISTNASSRSSRTSSKILSTTDYSASQPSKRQVRFSDSIEVDTDAMSTIEKMDGSGKVKVKSTEVTNALAVLKVIKILRYFSRILPAMGAIAHFPGLLDELIFNLRVPASNPPSGSETHNDDYSVQSENSFHSAHISLGSDYADAMSFYSIEDTGSQYTTSSRKIVKDKDADFISAKGRIDAIATIVNLAVAEENKTKLLDHPGLLEAVIAMAQNDPIFEAREHASIVIMNLALEDSNKVKMAQSDQLVNLILNLLTSNFVNIRRYASAIVLSLACEAENTVRLTTFQHGLVLAQLSQILKQDQVEEIRINVAECLFNCIRYSQEPETVEVIGEHRDVLPALSTAVLSDYSADVRAYAARTLEWLAADIHHDTPCHSRLLDALAEAALWTKTNCIVEAMKSQAMIAENRKSLVEHKGILDALSTLASLHGMNDQEVRESALVAIERLTHEPSTRHIMAAHQGIMTELTRATFSSSGIREEHEEDDAKSRRLMKSALKYLADAL